MVKKSEAVSKPKVKKAKTLSAGEREQLLIDNFIGLQRAMTNLSIRFEHLSENITKLLNVFEVSARNYVMAKGKPGTDSDREILNQLNYLIEQNKTLSKNMNAMQDNMRSSSREMPMSPPMSSPTLQNATTSSSPGNPPQGYQSSINNPFKPKPLQGI